MKADHGFLAHYSSHRFQDNPDSVFNEAILRNDVKVSRTSLNESLKANFSTCSWLKGILALRSLFFFYSVPNGGFISFPWAAYLLGYFGSSTNSSGFEAEKIVSSPWLEVKCQLKNN
ncbi:unnamed protein product [Protopolystoma xenopodis]|uniref:Uncharacterized protein n=1 Tax=Protopolystoma xenopodis TaxID=117903 RepID=A0A448WKD5_9PLAT|nr:unnamed protein product [Protopolystoma xenopodis]